MTTAFLYRPRKSKQPFATVERGETVELDERVEYVLSFPAGCPPAVKQRIVDLGGDLLADDLAVLGFGNFVGRTDLAGASINVISSKIGPDGVSRVLEEISALAAGLMFGWRAPTGFAAGSAHSNRAPVPYHQLQVLRRVMLHERPGYRLQDWLGAIERNPTRSFEPERPLTSLGRVRRLDNRAVQSIFTRLDRLVPVPAGAAIASSKLAQALTFGTPPQPHFPQAVAAPRSRLSFDTPENRFVRHVVEECLAVIYRFVDHPKLHQSLRADCRVMLGILEEVAEAPFVKEAGRLYGLRSPTQALAKADGYRDVLNFWNGFIRHISLPPTADETVRLLEGRDMARLYEYWVFLKVLEVVSDVMGSRPTAPTIRTDEFGETLVAGVPSNFGPAIQVEYNPTFMRSAKTSYSTPLRPDVVLTIAGVRYAFDAKYRLDRLNVDENDADEGVASYKRADLYKMHTYRDAIAGMMASFIVYPGTEFVFFEVTGRKHATASATSGPVGVGAIPLRPADPDPSACLREVISRILTPLPPPEP